MFEPTRNKPRCVNQIWLVTWEGLSSPVIEDDTKIAALIPARRANAFVNDFMELLYMQATHSVTDMLPLINKSSAKRDLRITGAAPNHILIGHSPFLFGRVVQEFKVIEDSDRQIEILSWIEPATFKNNPSSSGIVVLRDAKSRSLTRTLKPVSLKHVAG